MSHIKHVTITLDFDSARGVHTEYTQHTHPEWIDLLQKFIVYFKYAIQIVVWRFIKMCNFILWTKFEIEFLMEFKVFRS